MRVQADIHVLLVRPRRRPPQAGLAACPSARRLCASRGLRLAQLLVAAVFVAMLGGGGRARAQYHYHPLAWMSAEQVVCVNAPTRMSRAQLDEHLVAARRGDQTVPALELIASCAVPRREVSQALNEGGLVRHRAGDYQASAALFYAAVLADPSYLAARFNLACAYAVAGEGDAAAAELGELARAGAEARRWLRRVGTDPDLTSVRQREDVVSYVSGQATAWQPEPIAPGALPTPAPLGPAWEPLDAADWAPFRDLILRSGRVGERRGVRPAEPFPVQHASLDGLEAFTQPAFFRPEPGQVFLVVPFSIPGPNHRDGTVILFWTGSSYVRACHEYCRELGEPRARELRLRTADPRQLRFVSCRQGSSTCSSRVVHAYSSFVRHFGPALISGVTLGASPAP